MEYLILNEESIPYSSLNDANELFPKFIKLIGEAFNNHFLAIRVSDKIGKSWFDIKICSDTSLHIWLKDKDRDLVRKIKGIISKTEFPQIPEEQPKVITLLSESDFYISTKPGNIFPSVGAAHYLGQLLISFSSNPLWQNNTIKAIKTELIGDELKDTNVTVDNAFDNQSWLSHLKIIETQRKDNIKKGVELWEKRESEFSNLKLCGSIETDLKFLSVGDTIFNQLWKALKALDSYCKIGGHDFSLKSIKEKTNLDISDESESVKKNPKLAVYRNFVVDNNEIFFGYHVKNFSANKRLHFHPNSEERKIYVAYFGKHLPTKKNP